LMAAELVASLPGHVGIGQLLTGAGEQINFVGVWEAMITILIIGILVDALFFGTADRAIRRRYGLMDAAGS
jgi:NitT/TauT family transport system permease protein